MWPLTKSKLYETFSYLSDGYQQYTLQFVEKVVNRHYYLFALLFLQKSGCA